VGVAFGATPVARRESLAWSNRPLFVVSLVQLGYRDEAIQRIIGDNVLGVARAVPAGASS